MNVCMYAYTSCIHDWRGMPTRHLNYFTTLDRRNDGAVDGRLLPVCRCTCIRFVFHIMRLRSRKKKTAAPVSNLVTKVDLDSDH